MTSPCLTNAGRSRNGERPVSIHLSQAHQLLELLAHTQRPPLDNLKDALRGTPSFSAARSFPSQAVRRGFDSVTVYLKVYHGLSLVHKLGPPPPRRKGTQRQMGLDSWNSIGVEASTMGRKYWAFFVTFSFMVKNE